MTDTIDNLFAEYQEKCDRCSAPPGTRCESAVSGCLYLLDTESPEVIEGEDTP